MKSATGKAGTGTSHSPCWPRRYWPFCAHGEKKLQLGRCRSACPNCAPSSLTFSGADGTALNICCTGPNSEDAINSTRCAVTTGNEAHPCPFSIYNCSIKANVVFLLFRHATPIQRVRRSCPDAFCGFNEILQGAHLLKFRSKPLGCPHAPANSADKEKRG